MEGRGSNLSGDSEIYTLTRSPISVDSTLSEYLSQIRIIITDERNADRIVP